MRIDLAPLLQAEDDRRYLRARMEQIAAEEKYAKNEPGWVVGGTVYNTRWMPPDHEREGKW